ncbi:MAG: hypothetical protein ABI399_13665, partial [Bauldia sp.]
VEVRSSRLAEQALVLTALTLILLTPPILNIFDARVFFFGVPLLHIYCFAVWLAAIACGRWLARRMVPPPSGARSPIDRSADGGP